MPPRLGEIYATAFVTGASSGLGRAFARMLLAEGVRVWGTAREVARLADLEGDAFTAIALDLAAPAAAEAALHRVAAAAGGACDLVINNAGYGVFGEFAALPAAVWEAQVTAILGGTLRLSQVAFRQATQRGRGTLVNISSLAAEFPLPYMSGYNVAKAGLSALSESLIFEARGTGVTVIDFRPGDYRTNFNRAMAAPGGARSPAVSRAWDILERNLAAAPPPERAARDLRRALRCGRSGIVRSGSFFQARLAPFLARLTPAAVLRAASARYFGSR